MYDYWQKGIKLVIANRESRQDAWGERIFSTVFQHLIRRYGLKNLPKGGYDFVLFDARLRQEVVQMNEKNTNILYLLLWLGYDYVNIPYQRKQREIGRSRWTMSKKIKLFIDSFVAFSYFPIRVISVTGLVMGILAFAYAMFLIINKLTGRVPVEGWTTMMVVMVLLGAFQMIALGIIGEYVWRTLDATRKRPNFIVEKEHL
jgi:dolichol-phosphate mannosyltransferase